MKLITKEEKAAHMNHVAAEGFKGLIYGAIGSAGLFYYFKTRHPLKFKVLTPSVKTAMLAMPTISMAAFWADQGSWEFDQETYQSSFNKSKKLEEYREWNKLSQQDKIITSLNNQKYPIILSAWAASLYGSWVFVNRDKIMSTAQKAVQARMYAQALTIILLLGTVLLAVKEQEIEKKKPAAVPEWKKILLEREADAADAAAEALANSEKSEAKAMEEKKGKVPQAA